MPESPDRGAEATSVESSDIIWLARAAAYLAGQMRAAHLEPLHYWLAILAYGDAPWARLVDAYGGGTYADMMPRFRHLPPDWQVRRSAAPVHMGEYRRLIARITLFLAHLVQAFFGAHPQDGSGPHPSPQTLMVQAQAHRLAGQAPTTIGHYLVVLCTLPGPDAVSVEHHPKHDDGVGVASGIGRHRRAELTVVGATCPRLRRVECRSCPRWWGRCTRSCSRTGLRPPFRLLTSANERREPTSIRVRAIGPFGRTIARSIGGRWFRWCSRRPRQPCRRH
jgi:hypothetical protein